MLKDAPLNFKLSSMLNMVEEIFHMKLLKKIDHIQMHTLENLTHIFVRIKISSNNYNDHS